MWAVTVLGFVLMFVDLYMLIIFFFALRIVIKHYSKDYHINTKLIYTVVIVMSFFYSFESWLSDLSKPGNKMFDYDKRHETNDEW